MGHLPVDVLVDGVLRALRVGVLPAVQGRSARAQLFAVIDVLQNLRDRVELGAEALDAESASAARALEEAVEALGPEHGAALAAALVGAPAGPPAARAAALRAGVVAALAVLATLPEEAAPAARAAVDRHLAEQTMRELAALKPSLLEEISRG